MKHQDLLGTLKALGGYQFINSGLFEESNIVWVKMRYLKNEEGYRSLEFLAWLTTDMGRAGQALTFAPTAAPPYLNEPGKVLSFVLQFYLDDMSLDDFTENIAFIRKCTADYYDSCKP